MKRKNITSGIAHLDDVLGGGFVANRVYLIQGTPGCGKTTMALQFLIEGVRLGEKALYITLSESKEELVDSAASHGWSLDSIDVCDLIAHEGALNGENQYTMFHPSEVELNETTKQIIDYIEKIKPSRVVIDSMSEIKLLSQNSLRYRRQVLALKSYFMGKTCTALFLDDKTTSDEDDKQLQSITHGVIQLEQLTPDYGAERRRLSITKLRGQKYRGGFHDYTIVTGGLAIFPRIVAHEHTRNSERKQLRSGIKALDEIVGGGIDYGTSMLLLGPAGAGKSTLGLQYALAAAKSGERAAMFCFDERLDTLRQRADGVSMSIDVAMKAGLLTVQPVDPAEMSPGEFAHTVRQAAEGRDGKGPAKVVIIDSLNGYLQAMPEEKFLIAQLHELLTYLGHLNIITILIVAQHGLLGNAMLTPLDTSYLADSVILFRYFEAEGEVRQSIAVVKKRSGAHERTIREFRIDKTGLRVGATLRHFHGVLSGTPVYTGADGTLLKTK